MDSRSSGSSGPQRPLSVSEIAEMGVNMDYSGLIPLRYWIRTAETIFREAKIYETEGEYQQAYMLNVRFVELVLNHLDSHREVRNHQSQLNKLRKQANESLNQLDVLRPEIRKRYEDYVAQKRARQTSPAPSISSTVPYSTTSSSFSEHRPRRTSVPKPLDLKRGRRGSASSQAGPFSPPLERVATPSTANDRSLALDIARQEFEKREREKRERRREQAAKRGIGIPVDSQGREIRRVAPGTVHPRAMPLLYQNGHRDDIDRLRAEAVEQEAEERRRVEVQDAEDRRRQEEQEEQEALRRSIEELNDLNKQNLQAGIQQSRMEQNRLSMPPPPDSNRNSLVDYDYDLSWPQHERDQHERKQKATGSWSTSYPSVPKSSFDPGAYKPAPPSPSPYRIIDAIPPPPPKRPIISEPPPQIHSPVPIRPEKIPEVLPTPPPSSPAPSAQQFSTPASLENGKPLRTIFLPHALRSQFLQMAAPNTRNNLETCGILCGTLIKNALFISRLVIPEQTATSDTCTTKDEEALFEYCMAEDLMVLGWIHTHPTQTCFMSSVDLHTHCGYQLMMPESIAIVCAPSKSPSWGVFRLTDPPGVQTIMNCTHSGLFHPHDETAVYTDAMKPGHVIELKDMGFDVVDLRKGR